MTLKACVFFMFPEGMSRSDIVIGYRSDISQKTSIGLYRTASKISDINAPIQAVCSAPAHKHFSFTSEIRAYETCISSLF